MRYKQHIYQVDVANKESIIFINSIKVKNLRGFLWLWKNVFKIISSVKRHPGAYECMPGLVSPFQILMVSYWYNENELSNYLTNDQHLQFMRFIGSHPSALALYFERYTVENSGKYINGVFGLAKNFKKL